MEEDLKELLQEYAKEIHGERSELMGDAHFLRTLISSHRHLRSLNLENSEAIRAQAKQAHESAFEWAKNYALDHNWFSRGKLRSMTLAELAQELYEDEE